MPISQKIKKCKYCDITLTPEIKAQLAGRTCKPCRSKRNVEWSKRNYAQVKVYHKKYRSYFQKKKTKLTSENVLMIRELKQKGMTTTELALKFQVIPSRISNIIAKRSWKKV